MKCPNCLQGLDDDEILAEAKRIKARRVTPEERMRISERNRENVRQRWAKAKGERK